MKRSPAQIVIWITGASSGLGKAFAYESAARGYVTVLSGRSSAALKKLGATLKRKTGSEVYAIPCDVRSSKMVFSAAQTIRTLKGSIDVVINNAGVTRFKKILDTSDSEFDDIIKTNLNAIFYTTKAVVPHMVRKKRGKIINILSFAARTTYTRSGVYTASKMGAEGLMNVLREEVRHRGIKVLNVYPGAVDTPMWSGSARKKYASLMMSPGQVANAVFSLLELPENLMAEELILRPQIGDLQV